MSDPESDSNREQRFDDICADFLDAQDAGQPIDELAVYAANPDLADSLKAFFQDQARMQEVLQQPDTKQGLDNQLDPDATVARSHSPFSAARAELAVGQQIGDYELIEKIAQGGMGVVYKARQRSLNRIVALKMIRTGDLADQEEIKRFRIEAEAAAALQHPGIVPIYQIGSDHGQHYFSMAYVEGDSLAGIVRNQALAPKVAANYVTKVARATHYAHQQGIIHRDIKPANVLVDHNDEPLVTDFGLAKQIRGDDELTMSGQILGTASYMSPEQARGDQEQIGVRSDVYSLGALLYTLLTQRPPFAGNNPLDILLDVLSKDPDAPSSSNMALSRDLETITMKCLEKKPLKRYQTAAALADDLDRFLTGRPIAARPVSRLEHAIRWCQRKPGFAAAILLGAILAAGTPLAIFYAPAAEKIAGNSPQPRGAPALIEVARERYLYGQEKQILQAASEQTSSVEAAYAHATSAMLIYKEFASDEPGRPFFMQAATAIEGALNSNPEDEALRSGLADCYFQLSQYRTTPADEAVQYLDKSQPILLALVTAHPENQRLQSRIAAVKNAYNTSIDIAHAAYGSDAETKGYEVLMSMKDGPALDQAKGVVRFDFAEHLDQQAELKSLQQLQQDAASSRPDALLQYAHRLRMLGKEQEAVSEYQAAFAFLRQQQRNLSHDELRSLFSNLAILGEGQTATTNSLANSFWPTDVYGIYNAVLGMRLSEWEVRAFNEP